MQYLATSYNAPLVAVSIIAAILAAYVALELVHVAWKTPLNIWLNKWLVMSSLALGLGIWTMHFIGMFAFQVDVAIQYHGGDTALSLLIAIFASLTGFIVIRFCKHILAPIFGGIIMGMGIVAMHYLGMHAMYLAADMHHDMPRVYLSMLVSITVASVALWLLLAIKSEKIPSTPQNKVLLACLMGGAVASMHYIAMSAMSLVPNEAALLIPHGWMIKGDLMVAALSFAAILLILLPKLSMNYETRFAKRMEQELELLRTNESRLRTLIENAPDAFFVLNDKGKLLDANKVACEQLGYTLDELLTTEVFNFKEHAENKKVFDFSHCSFISGVSHTQKGVYLRNDGSEFSLEVNYIGIIDNHKKYIFALARDITETENLKKHLFKLAMTDELTELNNRRAFILALEQALPEARLNHQPLTLLMIDIDHFKKINDRYGHRMGDIALQQFAKITKNNVKKRGVIGRIGGEEFAVFLPNTHKDSAMELAEALLDEIESTPVIDANQSLYFTVSIGIAEFHHTNQMTASDLINNADKALYNAKRSGRSLIALHRG